MNDVCKNETKKETKIKKENKTKGKKPEEKIKEKNPVHGSSSTFRKLMWKKPEMGSSK